ncbi:MAG: hypothetical protein ABI625_15360 [bacterium]
MPTRRKKVQPAVNPGKVPRTFRLSSEKIAAAQRALGAATATEAIETALDLVVFRQGLIEGTRAMLGVNISSPDRDG